MQIARPKRIHLSELRIAGVMRRQKIGDFRGISAQWGDYNTRPPLAGAKPNMWYGVISAVVEGEMDYLCGQWVPEGDLPAGEDFILLPEGQYAQFIHHGPLADIGQLWRGAQREWMTRPAWTRRAGPMFETYDTNFDVTTNQGVFGICIPMD